MQIPGGTGDAGTGFLKAFQELIQRPTDTATAAQERAQVRPTDAIDTSIRGRSDVQIASRPADPVDAAARAAEFGAPTPRGSFIDMRV